MNSTGQHMRSKKKCQHLSSQLHASQMGLLSRPTFKRHEMKLKSKINIKTIYIFLCCISFDLRIRWSYLGFCLKFVYSKITSNYLFRDLETLQDHRYYIDL